MSKERLEVSKNTSIDGGDDGNTEVFVLPPNILEKLGIDLGNKNSPEDIVTSTIDKPENNDYESEPSILKTASLMKKSVLLSPTFNFMPANGPELVNDTITEKKNSESSSNGPCPKSLNINSEVDVISCDYIESLHDLDNRDGSNESSSNTKEEKKNYLEDKKQNLDESCSKAVNVLELSSSVNITTESSPFEFVDTNSFQSLSKVARRNLLDGKERCNSDIFIEDLIVINDVNPNNADISPINRIGISHSMDNNSVTVSTGSSTKTISGNITTESKDVIFINDEKLKDSLIQNEKHSNFAVTGREVSENIIIISTDTMDEERILGNMTSDSETNNMEIETDTITDTIVISHSGINELLFKSKENNKDSSPNNIDQKPKDNSAVCLDIPNIEKECKMMYNDADRLNNIDMIVQNNVNSKDIVNTPALKKLNSIDNSSPSFKNVANKLKKGFKTNSFIQYLNNKTNKDISVKSYANTIKYNLACQQDGFTTAQESNTRGGKSKSCIQGVEKPGGIPATKTYKVVKTYKRNKNSKSQTIHNLFAKPKYALENKDIELKFNKDENIDYKQDKTDSVDESEDRSSCYKSGEFCICSDFGRFHYYDDCEIYEHIHFWAHENIECDLFTLMSLYEDFTSLQTDFVTANSETNSDLNTIFDQGSAGIEKAFKEDLLEVVSVSPNTSDNMGHGNKKSSEDSSSNDCGIVSPNRHDIKDTITTKSDVKGLKRPIAGVDEGSAPKKSFKCGKCKQLFGENDWDDHKAKDNCHAVTKNEDFSEKQSSSTKKTKSFGKTCDVKNKTCNSPKTVVTCGVCREKVAASSWNTHIAKVHDYLAWKDSDTPLDMKNTKALQQHLTNLAKLTDGLICSKCGLKRKYGKLFLQHVNTCTGESVLGQSLANISSTEQNIYGRRSSDTSGDDNPISELVKKRDFERRYEKKYERIKKKSTGVNKSLLDQDSIGTPNAEQTNESLKAITESEFKNGVTCGVCNENVEDALWTSHMAKTHDYLAWKKFETPLDLNNEEAVHQHLTEVAKSIGELVCNKCGLRRKFVKNYLQHVRKCNGVHDSSTDQNSAEISSSEKNADRSLNTPSDSSILVTCGVCEEKVESSLWMSHKANVHNYLAWMDNEVLFDLRDEESVNKYLTETSKLIGGLICNKCGLKRKYGKSFMQHVRSCDGGKINNESVTENKSLNDSVSSVTCGVCGEKMEVSLWTTHMAKSHDYLAWNDTETPLDLNNDEAVQQHLTEVSKLVGGLVCNKCGLKRKYAKTYLDHIKNCSGEVRPETPIIIEPHDYEKTVSENVGAASMLGDETSVTCGVCAEKTSPTEWMRHIAQKHDYLAWKEGGTALDFNEEETKHQYLKELFKKIGSLTCSKCGLERRYFKPYINHINSCAFEGSIVDAGCNNITKVDKKLASIETGEVMCGVCLKKLDSNDWEQHRMEEHYNLAWLVGQTPFDFRNHYTIEKCLKEYKEKYDSLTCKLCKAVRGSAVGFYTHILTCGKTEEEIESKKITCEKCNKKYIYVYHNQHVKWHAEQDYKKQIKREAEEKVQDKTDTPEENETGGRCRRAAQKAIEVITKYKTEESEYKHVCDCCGFGTNHKGGLVAHVCKSAVGDFSDSGDSHHPESDQSSEEDDGIDEDISDEELADTGKRKRPSPPNSKSWKSLRLPFEVRDSHEYLLRSGKEYVNYHLSEEYLYPEWCQNNCEQLSIEEVKECMPVLEVSCKVKINGEDWATFKRFEARYTKGLSTLFVGASISCISWAPPLRTERNYLAVVCHRGPDTPRLEPDCLDSHHGIVQIWDFEHFDLEPRIVMVLRHDAGSVWGARWCPGGARHTPPGPRPRLGLLALASSDGSAYIYSVPYPPTDPSDNMFHKITPVVELRLSMNSERKKYQATSLDWSPEIGHKIIVVGYADGTTAYFDLTVDSPLLRTRENNVTVFYPYYDEKLHNTCVTDLSLCAGLGGSGVGAMVSASPTLANMSMRRGGRSLVTTSRLAAHSVSIMPLWPAAIVTGDEATGLGSSHCVSWCGGARTGWWRVACGCVHCARTAAANTPLVAIIAAHPARDFVKKKTVCSIDMTPFASKRKKLADDNLGIVVEPNTYEQAIKKYGLEFKWVKDGPLSLIEGPKMERFPLNDVVSLHFCPAAAHHTRLAVATHSGIIFLINT